MENSDCQSLITSYKKRNDKAVVPFYFDLRFLKDN
jgi:hypothetical protein